MEDKLVPVFRSHVEAMIGGDLDMLDEIFAPDFVNNSPGVPEENRHGPDGQRNAYRFLRSAFSDISMDHDDAIVDGDLVGLRWVWHAHHTGQFLHVAPTGAHVTIEGYDIVEVRDGKITQAWVYQDNLGLMAQLEAAASG
jgi:predicted ester cyclase